MMYAEFRVYRVDEAKDVDATKAVATSAGSLRNPGYPYCRQGPCLLQHSRLVIILPCHWGDEMNPERVYVSNTLVGSIIIAIIGYLIPIFVFIEVEVVLESGGVA